MKLKKRSWPVAVYDDSRGEFVLSDGTRFTLGGFRDLPEFIDQEAIRRDEIRTQIPVSVWFACYREHEEEKPN